MYLGCDVFAVFSIIFARTCSSVPIEALNRINIITNNDNYEINKYNLPDGASYVVQRLNNDNKNKVEYSVNIHHLSVPDFKFEKSEYQVNTNPTTIGIIGCFKVETTASGCVVYGLDSDDVYINKVFRVGPDSGLLYADSPINVGVYNFNVTADITNQQLHAVAKVVVTVKDKKTLSGDLKLANVKFKLSIRRTDAENNGKSNVKENLRNEAWAEDDGGAGDVNTNYIINPASRKLWNQINREGLAFGLRYSDVINWQKRNKKPEDNGDDSLFSNGDSLNFRRRRAVPPVGISTRPSVINAFSTSAVQSKRIYYESSIADTMMSGFVIFVVSFGSIFFFGSILYFAYKRLKKCGDYEVDEDTKSTTKPSDDETVYSTVQSDMKNPNILRIADLKQDRVVDSIEITKQKLSSSQTADDCNGEAVKETSFSENAESPLPSPPQIRVEDYSEKITDPKDESIIDTQETPQTEMPSKEETTVEEKNIENTSQKTVSS